MNALSARRLLPAIIAAIVLSACGGGDNGGGGDDKGGADKGTPVQGGTAAISVLSDFQSFNPVTNTHLTSDDVIKHMLFTPLIQYDDKLQPIPWLAERWELADTSVTFHLRRDVRWHDGQPVTAEDVKFTFDLAKDPATASLLGSRVHEPGQVGHRGRLVHRALQLPVAARAGPGRLLVAAPAAAPAQGRAGGGAHPERVQPQPGGQRPLQVRGMAPHPVRDAGGQPPVPGGAGRPPQPGPRRLPHRPRSDDHGARADQRHLRHDRLHPAARPGRPGAEPARGGPAPLPVARVHLLCLEQQRPPFNDAQRAPRHDAWASTASRSSTRCSRASASRPWG